MRSRCSGHAQSPPEKAIVGERSHQAREHQRRKVVLRLDRLGPFGRVACFISRRSISSRGSRGIRCSQSGYPRLAGHCAVCGASKSVRRIIGEQAAPELDFSNAPSEKTHPYIHYIPSCHSRSSHVKQPLSKTRVTLAQDQLIAVASTSAYPCSKLDWPSGHARSMQSY